MKRIFASLFVVGALVSMGVFASTAYFQTSQTGPGFTLTTGTASLAVADVGGAVVGAGVTVVSTAVSVTGDVVGAAADTVSGSDKDKDKDKSGDKD